MNIRHSNALATPRGRLPAIIAAAAIAIAAVAFVAFREREIVLGFTENELLEKLDGQLPWSKTYLFIFEVTLDNPRVVLAEGSDRISGGVDVTLNVYLSDQPTPIEGAVDMSGGVRYEPETGSLFLTDPHVENVRIAGVPDRYANRANEAISLALRDFYDARPIYVLSRKDARTAAARLLLKDVYVRDGKLLLKLSPARGASSAP